MAKACEWAKRVRQWRQSGERSEVFCSGKDYTAKNLLWWSSHFKRHGLPAADGAPGSVALLRVVRRSASPVSPAQSGGVVVEVGGARVLVRAASDRATLAMVVDVLRGGTVGGGR